MDPPEVPPAWTVSNLSGGVSLALSDGVQTGGSDFESLYAATEAGELLRVDPSDGSVGWRTSMRLTLDDGDGSMLLGAWYVGDSLFVVAGDPAADPPYTALTCRDPATGEVRWYDRRQAILRPLDIRDGKLYVAGEFLRKPTDDLGPNEPRSRSGRLRALDRETGAGTVEATIPSSFSVAAAPHGLYVQRQRLDDDARYSVVAFDRSLSRRWQVDTDSQIGRSLATTTDGVLYTVDDEFALLDAVTGEARWTVGGWTELPRSPDVLPDGTIYAGVDPVKQISPDGVVLNSLPAGVSGDAVVSPSMERVYIDDRRAIHRIDRTSAELRWSYEPSTEEYTDVAALPGQSVVATRGISAVTILDVLDGTTGSVQGEIRPERGVSEAAAVDGLLIVATHDWMGGYDIPAHLS